MIPLRTDSPLRHTPYMNWALIAINVVVFLFQQAGPNPRQAPWYLGYELNPGAPAIVDYFTYAFLHAGFWHIAGNMLFLYVFGNNVNDKMGHIGYLGFYLAGAVFAGVAYCATAHAPFASTLGASGAIAAVVGAYLILFPRSNITVLNIFIFIGFFELASFWFIIVFFLFQDVFMYMTATDNVAHTAHIGGTLFGMAVCFVLLWLQLLPRDQYDVVALFKQWNRRRVYRDAVNSGWNPYLTPGPRRRREGAEFRLRLGGPATSPSSAGPADGAASWTCATPSPRPSPPTICRAPPSFTCSSRRSIHSRSCRARRSSMWPTSLPDSSFTRRPPTPTSCSSGITPNSSRSSRSS